MFCYANTHNVDNPLIPRRRRRRRRTLKYRKRRKRDEQKLETGVIWFLNLFPVVLGQFPSVVVRQQFVTEELLLQCCCAHEKSVFISFSILPPSSSSVRLRIRTIYEEEEESLIPQLMLLGGRGCLTVWMEISLAILWGCGIVYEESSGKCFFHSDVTIIIIVSSLWDGPKKSEEWNLW